MEPSDTTLKQPAGVSSFSTDYTEHDDSSSDESDTNAPHTTLTDNFKEVVLAFEDIIDLLRSESSAAKGHSIDRFRQAKKLSENLLSIVLTWACDIRIDDGNLNDYNDTIFGLVVQTSLVQIGSRLRSLVMREFEAISVDIDRLLNSNFQGELLDSISSLQSQVKAIRMSQAVKYSLGPLDGLAKDIETISDQYTVQEISAESEDSLKRTGEDTTEIFKSTRPLHSREAPSASLEEIVSFISPLTRAKGEGFSKLDPRFQSDSSLRLAQRTAFEQLPLTMVRYEHIEIDPKSSIRLLILRRGTGEDRIECSMTIVPSVGHQIQYTAISHVWGSAPVSSDIWIRNSPPLRGIRNFRNVVRHVIKYRDYFGAYIFPLRPNLHSALKHLRRKDQDLTLWVDALCVDRNDLYERNMLVEDMADIYQGAEKVSVWLGEGNENSDTAFSFMQDGMDPIRDLSVDQRGVLGELLRAQWFRRLWTVQELALAKRAWLHCGTKTIEWVEFADYVELMYTNFTRTSELLGPSWETRLYRSDSISQLATSPASLFVRVVKDLFEKSKDGEILVARLSLEYLVYTLSKLEVSDPRDTIYALLSLAKDTRSVFGKEETGQRGLVLRPDYSKDYFEVFRDFTKFCIQSSRSLDLICRPWARGITADLPSWIPRLQERWFGDAKGSQGRINSESLVGIPGRSYYNASGRGPSTTFFKTVLFGEGIKGFSPIKYIDRSIIVLGFQVDKIMEAPPRVIAGVIPREWFLVSGLHVDPGQSPRNISKVPKKLWRTLVADRDPKGRLPPTWYHQACVDALYNVNGNGDLDVNAVIAESKSPLMTQYLERVRDITWNRRLTRTRNGRLGLLPAGAEALDLVCVLQGCSVPVLLRPLDVMVGDGFELIGECYIDGIMEGEAVEGFGRIQEFEIL
ncbi:hypothetical protein MMC18_008305 [Xylographa bjoerkii]|nr:hypothetical protein [Xylographa bjoerkii]